MSIKVNIGDYKVILSESFIITHNDNILSLESNEDSGKFKLKFVFEKKISKNENDRIVARIESEVNDGLTLRLHNLFHVEAAISAKGLTRFFREKIKNEQEQDVFLAYYFSFSSQSLSDSDDSILFSLNIATKIENSSQDSED
ncbi:hypothetical protein OKT22_05530 [Providencia rettgeri]|uniref:DUF6864 domain-containing function n=1 Tax=Providencia rettgeri TaxID=587 RepID=UPI0022722523|nr:hypothetical protein [Providencia rettgeri]MCX9108490.1 hypothetical protein [Providencia rettgeri]